MGWRRQLRLDTGGCASPVTSARTATVLRLPAQARLGFVDDPATG
jgi:hypothetical protein